MRSPLCSLELTPESLARVRHCARGLLEVLDAPALLRARWLSAVTTAARAVAQAGGGTLALDAARGSDDDPEPWIAAEMLLAGGTVDALPPDNPALARARALVDQFALEPRDDGLGLRLKSRGAGAGSIPNDAALRARVDALLKEPLPTVADLLQQQEQDASELLEALQAELAAARRAQAELVGQIAHDLRSPLLTLNLSLEMLRMKPHSPAELEERREVMKRQTDELRALSASLLKASAAGRTAEEGASPPH